MSKRRFPFFCMNCVGGFLCAECEMEEKHQVPCNFIDKNKNDEDTRKLEKALDKSIETGQDFFGTFDQGGLIGDYTFLDGETDIKGNGFSITHKQTPFGTVRTIKVGD